MITSFRIEWHNWGVIHCVYDLATEITNVYRRKKLLTIGQYNAIGNAFITESLPLCNEDCDRIFTLIESIIAEVANHNYMQPVDDGYHWRLLIRYSDKHVQIIEGTIIAPNAAYELELAIRDILHSELYRGKPQLFGICQ